MSLRVVLAVLASLYLLPPMHEQKWPRIIIFGALRQRIL